MRPTRISIGDFNWRVTFYTQADGVRDDYGNPTLSTGSGNAVWANVKAKPQGYVMESGAVEYRDGFEIKIRRPFPLAKAIG